MWLVACLQEFSWTQQHQQLSSAQGKLSSSKLPQGSCPTQAVALWCHITSVPGSAITSLTQVLELSPRADVHEVSSQGAAAAASTEDLVQEE